ncbi:transcriptional regulator [bacterium]|nr:transcriptional regulator [bacterium]
MWKDSDESLPSLSPAEWEVMKVVWDRGNAAARDVFAALPEERGWAYKTVKTLLSRLVDKGALDYVAVGNSYLYNPVYTRDQLSQQEAEEFVGRVHDGSSTQALAAFVRQSDLTPADIARLRELLDAKEREITDQEDGS